MPAKRINYAAIYERDQLAKEMMSTQGIMYRAKILRAVGFDETLPAHFGDFIVLMRMAEGWDVRWLIQEMY
mgnify:CR=1 FL=1